MTAKKCDRCGKFYEEYNVANDEKNVNTIRTYNCEIDKGVYSHGPYDLCPECSKQLVDWLFKFSREEK